jgi:hypothetical protein
MVYFIGTYSFTLEEFNKQRIIVTLRIPYFKYGNNVNSTDFTSRDILLAMA